MDMLSFEEFQEEIGNEGAREVLRKGLGLLKRADKGTNNLINKYVPGGKYGNMTTDEVGQAIKQGIQKGRQRVQQTVKKGKQKVTQVAQQAAQTIMEHKEEIAKAGTRLADSIDEAMDLVNQVPIIRHGVGPEMKIVAGGVRLFSDTVRNINKGQPLGVTIQKLTTTLNDTMKAAESADKKMEKIAETLHDHTEKGKAEKARKKLKEISITVGKVLGMIGGSGAVAYGGYKGYQKVTGSNEDFYALEDITESNYSEITELLTEVKHIIDTSTSTNDLYSKLQHLEKAKRKELQDVVYGRFTSLTDHKKVELNHLLVEISDGCRAKNITLEQAFSTSPWIWRAFKKTCTLVGVTLNMLIKGALVAGTAGVGLFAYKNKEVAKAVWKGIKGLKSGVGIANTILKR